MRWFVPIALVSALSTLCVTGCGGSNVESVDTVFRTVQSAPLVDITTPPPPGVARPFSLPSPVEIELDNGLSVTLIDRPDFPTLSVRISVDGGYSALPDDMGTSALLARTLRDGAGEWDSETISRMIDAGGIRFSTSIDHDRLRIAADALSTRFDTVLDLVSTLLAEPTFPIDRAEARRDELVGELELAASQPTFHLARAMRRAIFPEGHPYSRSSPTIDEVRAAPLAALPEAWSRVAGPAVSRVVIVGALPDDAVVRVAESFGAWRGGPAEPTAAAPVTVDACNEAHVVARPNSAQTNIAWLGAGVAIGSDGWFDALVANQVLGGGPSARLFMNLREDKSYTYGAYSSLEQWGDGVFRAASNVRGDVTGPALDEFVAEFSRFAADPLSDLDDARAYLSGVFPIEHQTNAQLAGRVAGLLDRSVPLSYLAEYRDAVTDADETAVRSAGATLFEPTTLTLVMVGERDLVVPAAEAHASVVYVYDLAGDLLEVLPGAVESTCGD